MATQIPITVPPRTSLLRLVRVQQHPSHWMLWINTKDFVYGTFIRMYDNGCVERVTVREDFDDVVEIKPADGDVI